VCSIDIADLFLRTELRTLAKHEQVAQIYRPDIVNTIFVKPEAVNAIGAINQQLYILTHTAQHTHAAY